MDNVLDRMLRAAKLDQSLYWELGRDPRVPVQAGLAILIISLSAVLLRLPIRSVVAGFIPYSTVAIVILNALVGTAIWWLLLSLIYYWVGTRYLHGSATPQAVVYGMAFALAPAVLQILLLLPVPGLAQIGSIVIGLWLFLSQSTAVRLILGLQPMYAFIMVFAATFLLRIALNALLPGLMGSLLTVF